VRIAHVGVEIVPTGAGAFVGGLVKNVATIGAQQAANGHRVDVFTTDLHGSAGNGAAHAYGRIHRIRTRGRYGSLPFAASFVSRAAREIRRTSEADGLDLLHVHSAYASLGVIGRRLRAVRAPKVFSLYSPNFRMIPGHDHKGGTRRFARRALEAFDAVLVPSDHLRTRAVAAGISTDAIVKLPPALDPSMLRDLPSRDDARRWLDLPAEAPVVLFLGNYSPWKGVEDLLRAMRGVCRRRPEAILLAAWGEPYDWSGNRRDAVLALIRELGLENAVHQVGIVEDVRQVLRACDVLVSPFHCTCKVLDYPLSILEAMACERPVIGTRVGGLPEVLGDGSRGSVVEPQDIEALEGAIDAVLADPREAERLGRHAAHWARASFRPDVIRRDLDALYTRLGSSPPT